MRTPQTFYIASPYRNHERANELALELERRGLRWALNHNWTKIEFEATLSEHSELWPTLASLDVQAAIAADLFILLLEGAPSPGATAEMTARWSHHREVHMVVPGGAKTHLFHKLPGIIIWGSEDDILSSLDA